MRFPDLWWQTGCLLCSCVPRCLSLARHPASPHLDGRCWDSAGQLRGLLTRAAAPGHWASAPKVWLQEAEPSPTPKSVLLTAGHSCPAFPPPPPAGGTCNFTSLRGEASKFSVWALGAGWLLCLTPSLKALFSPLKCQPGVRLLIGVSKIASWV